MGSVPASKSSLKYRPDIDGLRALAVLSAVAYHFFPEWMHGAGFTGPEVFFVISGYLISTIIFGQLERGTFSFGDFYFRRIRRIFPALLIVLSACLVAGWFFLPDQEYQELGKHVAAGAGFASNLVLWGEAGYFDAAAESKILLHLWTLGIEEQFYLVWPLLVWVCWKLRASLLVTTLVVIGISFYSNISTVYDNSESAFYLPQSRFWELMSGAILAWLTLHKDRLFDSVNTRCNGLLDRFDSKHFSPRHASLLANAAAVLGAALLCYGLYGIKSTYAFPGYWAVIPVAGTLLIIMAGPTAWLNKFVLSNRVMIVLGLISYPLYLWHWPVLSFAKGLEYEHLGINMRLALAALSILLGWLTYKLIETPVRLYWRGTATAITLFVSMVVVGGAGYLIFKENGIQSRFSPEASSLTKPINFLWLFTIRWDRCHLQNPDLLKHDKVCYETERPLIGLWGDSDASSLYPGLKKLQEERHFGVMQLTQAGCGPIFDLEKLLWSPNCNQINQDILKDFVNAKPDILLLHAAWDHYTYPLTDEELYVKFSKTIQEIKAALPGTRIIIIGPTPQWNVSPQRVSFSYWRRSLVAPDEVPVLQSATIKDATEKVLVQIAKENDVDYISAISELCKDSLCISRVGARPEDFIAIDTTHFSKAGSEFFVKKIGVKIFGE